MNYLFIKEFLGEIRGDLQRVAYKTKGEFDREDLENEAYFLLKEFAEKFERQPNKFDASDKSWVLSRLFNKFVKWVDHSFKHALRIHSLEDDNGENWVLELAAPENINPLAEILFKEERSFHQSLFDHSYSEAKAYVVIFDNFNQDKKTISRYLHITSCTLNQRFNRALILLFNQPSLFDFIEIIDESFNPIAGKPKVPFGISSEKNQLAWSF